MHFIISNILFPMCSAAPFYVLCVEEIARACVFFFLVPDSVGTYSGYSAAAITEDNRLGKCCFFAL